MRILLYKSTFYSRKRFHNITSYFLFFAASFLHFSQFVILKDICALQKDKPAL